MSFIFFEIEIDTYNTIALYRYIRGRARRLYMTGCADYFHNRNGKIYFAVKLVGN